jgi:hypothetical protein
MAHYKKEYPILKIWTEEGYDLDIDNNPTYNKLIGLIDKSRWYYTDKKIWYHNNEYGYRSDNMSTINDNDYILSFGCSYTFGVGLFYEDTYAYKLSKELNLKNINLGIPGSSSKEMMYNTTLFINSYNKKRLPKYVVYQYPHDYRVPLCKYNEEFDSLNLTTDTANTPDFGQNEYIKNYYLENSGEKYLQDLLVPLYLNNIWTALGVPVFHITFDDYIQEYKSDFQDFEIMNVENIGYAGKGEHLYHLARDLSHNGIEFHDKVYKTVLNKIKNG